METPDKLAHPPEIDEGLSDKYEWASWEKRWPVFDPSKRNPWLEKWELCMLLMLILITILDPVQIVFRTPEWDALLGLNLFTNAFFLGDMAITFMCAYPSREKGGVMVKRPRSIVLNYLKGQFVIDFVASVPIDLIILGIMENLAEGTDSSKVKLARLMRLLRLVRLLRLTNLGRLTERLQANTGLRFSTMTITKLVFIMLTSGHLAANVWAFTGLQLGFKNNWISATLTAKDPTNSCKAAADIGYVANDDAECQFLFYIMALYWAFMTMTTIGYGDIVAYNIAEYSVMICLEITCAMIWAVILGEVCSVLIALSPHETKFKQRLDDVNRLAADQRMPQDLRRTLRSFFFYGKRVQRYTDQLFLLGEMSPMLRGQVSMRMHSPWLNKVGYLQGLDTETVLSVARMLNVQVLAPHEEVQSGQRKLWLVRKGLCAVDGRIKVAGDFWGEDMVLESLHLRKKGVGRALSFTEVLMLHYNRLIQAIKESPTGQASLQRIKKARVKLAVRRGIVLIARAIRMWEFRTGKLARTDLSAEQRNHLHTMAVRGLDHDCDQIYSVLDVYVGQGVSDPQQSQLFPEGSAIPVVEEVAEFEAGDERSPEELEEEMRYNYVAQHIMAQMQRIKAHIDMRLEEEFGSCAG